MNRLVTIYKFCTVTRSGTRSRVEKLVSGRGVFIMYGFNCIENEQNAGNYTTAIIEMEDGTVSNIDVELISFDQPGFCSECDGQDSFHEKSCSRFFSRSESVRYEVFYKMFLAIGSDFLLSMQKECPKLTICPEC